MEGKSRPDGVNRMVRDIRMVEHWLGKKDLYIDKSVLTSKVKLERSIATIKELKTGHVIQQEDLHLLSPGDGYKWSQISELVGKTVVTDIPANEVIYPQFIK